MSYAAVSDLVERFGEQELTQLTDRSTPPASEIAQDVAQAALDSASGLIDGYVARKYQLPLLTPPPLLTDLCCDIARYRLYADQAPEKVVKDYDGAIKTLTGIANGLVKIDAAGVEPAPRPAVVISTGNERRTDRQSLRDF